MSSKTDMMWEWHDLVQRTKFWGWVRSLIFAVVAFAAGRFL